MENNEWCHLHTHSHFSILDGLGSPEQYAKRASYLGFEYLCITDHANVDCAPELQKACEEHNLKPIFATELYIVEDIEIKDAKEKRAHICLFAKNIEGWQNIQKMISISNINGFYKRPRIDSKTLLSHLDGLCVSTACVGSFIRHKWGKKLFKQLNEKLQEDLYLEVQPHNIDLQREHNELCVKASKKFGRKIIATNDSHYIRKEDAKTQEVALAIRTKGKMDDPNRYKFPVDKLYYAPADEFRTMWSACQPYEMDLVEEWMGNTLEIAKKCSNFRLQKLDINLPQIPQCKGMSTLEENQFLKNLIKQGLKEFCPKGEEKKYKARLSEEWGLIERKGFVRYFLIVWELMDWCKGNGVPLGPARGSCAGSLILYLIGVTQVDPIKWGLLFSRFLSEARSDLPDIDADFGKEERPLAIEHLKEIYGRDHVAQITNLQYMGMKSAFRDVCRVYGIEAKDVNSLMKKADAYMEDNKVDKFDQTVINSVPELSRFMNQNGHIAKHTYDIAGTVRGYGKHAAGIVLAQNSLMDGVNCSLTKRGDSIMANWDKRNVEDQGLLKLDVLGLKEMSIIARCLTYIKENTNEDLNLLDLEFNDKKIFRMLSQGKTTGIFQLSGWSAMRICKEMGIDSFADMVLASAICRPGPDSAEIIKRKKAGRWKKVHQIVDGILDDTYGVMVYQEQAMKIFNQVAGFSMEKTEKMRKLISKSLGADEMNKNKKEFMDGCEELAIVDANQADALWTDIVEFSKYSFNLSHCVSYTFISYWNSWLTIYYPAEYLAASLSLREGDSEKELFKSAVEKGLTIHLPKIGISDATVWKAKDSSIYCPITAIKGIGDANAEKVLNRPKPKNIGFFEEENQREGLPKNVVDKLDAIRFFDKDIKLNRSKLRKVNELFEFDTLLLDS